MRLLHNFLGKSKKENAAENINDVRIYAPIDGTVIPLEEINDGVFSAGVLGKGCGIRPETELITAPFDGEIIQVAETKHALGLSAKNGVELLIHVGLDTVAMNGDGFKVHVKVGDKIKCGQKLLSFDRKAIAQAGCQDVTVVVVTNSEDYEMINFLRTGNVTAGTELLAVK